MFDKYTTEGLIELLEEDFRLLASGDWAPDLESISAPQDVLAEIKKWVDSILLNYR